MAKQFLQYTNLTFEEILQAIKNRISDNSDFDNFRESSIYSIVTEIFAASVDMVNYNLERRAEENFVDTCRLRSSALLLARQLGYVIQRPIPASGKMKIKISGDISSKGIVVGDTLEIPIYSSFEYNSTPLILKNTYYYTMTDSDISSISADASDYEKILTVNDDGNDIDIIQGEQLEKVILGETNDQVGQVFQTYKLEDQTFSNIYGGGKDYDTAITTVKVGKNRDVATDYDIDRRSLINVESLENFIQGDEKDVCVIRTSRDENVEVLFGDAQYAAIGANVSASGPTTEYDNIYVKYLSTKGKAGNQTGIIDEKLTSDISVDVGGHDITDNVEFLFRTNITGGADMESIDSIKTNAPNIYHSLDRLITKRDYKTYLQSLTSPFIVKNALVWGEQDEMTENNTNEPIQKLYNCILFSILGSLYNLTGGTYSYKTNDDLSSDSVLDLDYDINKLNYQNYFNTYVKQNIVDQLETYDTSGTYYILYGDTFTSSDFDTFVDTYEGFKLSGIYKSDLVLSDDDYDRTYGTSAISVSGASTCADIATSLTNAFNSIIDTRGTEIINSNYNDSAFANIECVYDTNNSTFIISADASEDICYLYNINDSDANDVITDLGFNNKIAQKATKTINDSTLVSNGISNVVSDLDNKAQVTVRHVYLTPIIHRLNLNGNVYLKKLADKGQVKSDIYNSIYEWLDKNANFKENIYLSNVIELIEDYPSVNHANVNFEVDNSTTTFNSSTNTYINKNLYSDVRNNIAKQFNSIYTSINSNSNLTIRKFFEYVETLYGLLPSSNSTHTPFRDTDDFINAVSDMYDDFQYNIKNNLIDSNGNISNYSMGNEIIQVKLNLTFNYI